MRNFKPLYQANITRSGSFLLRMMLSTNPDLTIASEPFFELYKSFRDAVLRTYAPELTRQVCPPLSPILDYYFTDQRIEVMETIQQSSIDLSFEQSEWDSFSVRLKERMALDCADLSPHADTMRGETYRDIFNNGRNMIARVRKREHCKWVGSGDNWTIEFMRPLARSFPDAKFLVLFRDPRATISSNLGEIKKNPAWVAQPLSYIRHWRKLVAFTLTYQGDALFKDRLFVLRHEDILSDPEKIARALCAFLEVDYHSDMIDTDKYYDFTTGGTWAGNSAFETSTKGISMHRATRWKTMLDPQVWKLIDYLCAPEMRLLGYEPQYENKGELPDHELLTYLIQSEANYASWKSNLGDLQLDLGFELFRNSLIQNECQGIDQQILKRNFLFEDIRPILRSGEAKLISY